MARVRWHRVLLTAAVTLVGALPTPSAEPRDGARELAEARALAARIDGRLEARASAARVQPAAAADDAEFLRRIWLDLAGTIPSVSEARAFLDDRRPDKRERLVQRLLQAPSYANHFRHVWRAAMLPESANVENLGLDVSFEAWLHKRLSDNVGYDRMAREILGAIPRGNGRRGLGEVAVMDSGGGVSPAAFYAANENKPENLAGSTARTLLAVKLECAQCHNHPHADWKQEQFWAYAAFFGGTGREIRMPKTAQLVKARFPDGKVPSFTKGASPGSVLADWMTRDDNPYFARAATNRVWAYLLGTGLVEPVDDLSQDTETDGLLDDVARDFARHGYDLKYLIRALVLTRAYQRSSVARGDTDEDVRVFARMPVRALAPEQVFDVLAQATGIPAATPELAARFARQQTEKPTEVQASILQALTLMNGKLIDDATGLEKSATLAAVANAPFLDTAGRIETLYLAALSRKPRPDERDRLIKYVERGGPSGDREQALADVFWALLNSGEFLLNH
jgi:hypothetical protein